jgi:hypothetical protein
VSDALATLTQINLDDLIGAFGWGKESSWAAVARRAFRAPARRFAIQMLSFDTQIAEHGLTLAARHIERNYARSVRVYGRGGVPTGPVLFLSNHPGVTDTLAVLASIDRVDLRIIALNRPFLLSLPNLSHQLAYVSDDGSERVALVRSIGRHLRHGGAVLTFPAGRNEPDPDFFPNAAKSLESWIDSAQAFARLAPELVIVPVCVRGVLWPAAATLPVVRGRPSWDDQLLLASALQLVANVGLGLRPVSIRVAFGSPIRAASHAKVGAAGLHQAVLREMTSLLAEPPQGEGEEVL